MLQPLRGRNKDICIRNRRKRHLENASIQTTYVTVLPVEQLDSDEEDMRPIKSIDLLETNH